ncbi:MAG: hypothetical protein ABIA04_08505 [Pseudomonadota bacterium]
MKKKLKIPALIIAIATLLMALSLGIVGFCGGKDEASQPENSNSQNNLSEMMIKANIINPAQSLSQEAKYTVMKSILSIVPQKRFELKI